MSGATISTPGPATMASSLEAWAAPTPLTYRQHGHRRQPASAPRIHTVAPAGGTLNIDAAAVINAGASGVAIRDGDGDRNGIDETGGNAIITTAGTINGAIVLGGGTDTLTVTGGAINGNITGDGADALNLNVGANSFSHGASYAISGMDSIVMNSGTARLDGTISANTLTVKGGTLVLGNTAAFAGATSVEGGTLAVNGTLAGSVNVLAAGRLQGSGTVGSTTVAGIVAPGNSIGTLTVNGNYAQAAGSTYQVEVDPASTASDLIHATGTANIAGGSNLQVCAPAAVATSSATATRCSRPTAASPAPTPSTAIPGAPSPTCVDSYDANNVYLTAEQMRSFTDAADYAQPGRGRRPRWTACPTATALGNAVAWLPSDVAARDAFNQLSVDIHASTKTALLEDSRFVQEAAIDRLRTASCAPGSAAQAPQQPSQQAGTACVPESRQPAAWSQVFGSWGSIDGNGNAAKLKRDIGGFVVGADTGVGAGWRVGGLAGYSRASADTDARNSSAKTDSYHLGVYGGTQWGATALRLGANHSWNKTETSRSVGFAGFADSLSAEYDSTTTQLFGEAGHRIDAGRVALEPFARPGPRAAAQRRLPRARRAGRAVRRRRQRRRHLHDAGPARQHPDRHRDAAARHARLASCLRRHHAHQHACIRRQHPVHARRRAAGEERRGAGGRRGDAAAAEPDAGGLLLGPVRRRAEGPWVQGEPELDVLTAAYESARSRRRAKCGEVM